MSLTTYLEKNVWCIFLCCGLWSEYGNIGAMTKPQSCNQNMSHGRAYFIIVKYYTNMTQYVFVSSNTYLITKVVSVREFLDMC